MNVDVLIVGAGVAGLSCARDLTDSGRSCLVLDRARGVGGRCATRRFEDQPIDFGVLFLHGYHPGFLAEVEAIEEATLIGGWPRRVSGSGTPCQPEAFAPYERRFAIAEGIHRFARHLARGLEVRLQTAVVRIEVDREGFSVFTQGGDTFQARDLVVALALEQSATLIRQLPSTRELESVLALLGLLTSLPCLTVMAAYPLDLPEPDWDVQYPDDSAILHLISHESSKRSPRRFLTLVYQALPAWSAIHLDQTTTSWERAMLGEASRYLGAWAAEPLWAHPHCWRHARVDSVNELANPLLIRWEGGPRLGLAGDLFSPGGGVQAAWLSGRKLAHRLTEE